MEKRLKAYEQYLNKAIKHPTADLANYHHAMLRNFQHERLIHLLVTLACIVLTLIFVFFDIFLWANFELDDFLALLPFHIVIVLMLIIDLFYLKHYYFLENHLQKLYDLEPKLYHLPSTATDQKQV